MHIKKKSSASYGESLKKETEESEGSGGAQGGKGLARQKFKREIDNKDLPNVRGKKEL